MDWPCGPHAGCSCAQAAVVWLPAVAWGECGPSRRWRDVISAYLRHIGIEHLAWYGIGLSYLPPFVSPAR